MEKISGVNVCGFIDGEFGLGEGVRTTIRSLEDQNIPTSISNLKAETSHRRKDKSYRNFASENPFPVNIIQLNGDKIFDLERFFGASYLQDKYNIGYWAWELPDFPADWTESLYCFDELWTPSNFCVEAFSPISPIPVLKMPHSICVPETSITRKQLKLPPQKFIFLFIFDFLSVFERKNPLGVIEAFKKAFGEDERVLLYLKSINGKSSGDKLNFLKTAAGNNSNIKIVDGVWDRKQIEGLLWNCDAYVSLHRSEGFGLTIAEAAFCAKPVIATDYSANSEYMNANNSFPVRYKLEKLKKDYQHYKKGGSWAEPDVSHAAELMRQVVNFPEEAKRIGERGSHDVRAFFSAEVIGKNMRRRLEFISFINDNFQTFSDPSSKFAQIAQYKINLNIQARKIIDLENRIKHMETSRFWKIRNKWFELKNFWRAMDKMIIK